MDKNQLKDVADYVKHFGATAIIELFNKKPKPDWNDIVKIAQNSKSDRAMAAAWALAANSTYGIPKEGKTSSKIMIMDMDISSILYQQKVGRVERKSPNTEGVAIDLDMSEQLKARIAIIDKTKDEMNKALGIPADLIGDKPKNICHIHYKELLDELMNDYLKEDHLYRKGIHKIYCPELLNDLLNYKPKNKTMKKFKNRFAVKGDIINLLRFERKLNKLGYRNMTEDIINWRSASGEAAKYITCGVHFITSLPGHFVGAANSGGTTVIFDVDTDFDAAVEYASQLNPLFYTFDGTPIFDTETNIYGVRKLNTGEVYEIGTRNVYRNHYIIEIKYSNQKSDLYTWFSSEELAKQYIDNTVPLLVTEDGVEKFVNDQAYCVRPNFTSYWIKKGLDEKTPWSGYKYFHSDDVAQKYIDENKPRFSKKQIRNIVNNSVSTINVTIPQHQTVAIHYIDGEELKKAFNL